VRDRVAEFCNENCNHKRRITALVSAFEGKYVTAYADGETADLVKSSQVNLLIKCFRPPMFSCVLAKHLRAFSNYFSDSPRLHIPRDYEECRPRVQVTVERSFTD